MEPIQPEASTASTGKGIRYIGEHAYAYNIVGSDSDPQTVLEFTTGSGYIVCKAYFTGPTKFSDPNSGREANWQLSLNDIIVGHVHNDTSEGDITQQGVLKFLIPPFTDVKIEVDVNDVTASYLNGVILTGRVYGAA